MYKNPFHLRTKKQFAIVAHLMEFGLIHPDELDKFSAAAIGQLKRRGVIEDNAGDGIIDFTQSFFSFLLSRYGQSIDFAGGSFPTNQFFEEHSGDTLDDMEMPF